MGGVRARARAVAPLNIDTKITKKRSAPPPVVLGLNVNICIPDTGFAAQDVQVGALLQGSHIGMCQVLVEKWGGSRPPKRGRPT